MSTPGSSNYELLCKSFLWFWTSLQIQGQTSRSMWGEGWHWNEGTLKCSSWPQWIAASKWCTSKDVHFGAVQYQRVSTVWGYGMTVTSHRILQCLRVVGEPGDYCLKLQTHCSLVQACWVLKGARTLTNRKCSIWTRLLSSDFTKARQWSAHQSKQSLA